MKPISHLFLLCMNNSWSTLLQEYLGTSKKIQLMSWGVIPFSDKTNREWHFLAKKFMPLPHDHWVVGIWTEKTNLFTDPKNYNWPKIKRKWNKKWNKNLSRILLHKSIFFEKSPPNVLRSGYLEAEFDNAMFIVMMRNPYAVCEWMMRRLKYSSTRCAKHWWEVAKQQIKNMKERNTICWFRYEDIFSDPESVEAKIHWLHPELSDFSFSKNKKIKIHSIDPKNTKLKNFNETQINNLGNSEIKAITSELRNYEQEMEFFWYQFL